ncbi:ROK family transcriptional regulator [Longispora urticae]
MTSLLRRMTHVTTLRALRSGGAMTVAHLARKAGLSRPTVMSLLDELVEQGWVEEQPPDTSGGMGRPAKRFRFRVKAGYVVGVDIGAHTIRAAIADLSGETVATRREAIAEHASAPDRLALARRLVEATMDDAKCGRGDVLGAAVGTPGIVDPAGRVTLSVLPEWSGFDLGGRMGRSFTCPVLVENDANLATLAEHWRGTAREADTVVHVLAGLRFGAGLIIDGKLHRGRSGAAGEIGALDILGWDEAPRDLIKAAEPGTGPELAAQQLFAAAKDRQPHAMRAVERFAQQLAQGIAAMVLTVDPDVVVVGGGVSLAGKSLLEPLTEHLHRLCLTSPPIRMSELGDEAVVLGALRLALQDVERRVFAIEDLPI